MASDSSPEQDCNSAAKPTVQTEKVAALGVLAVHILGVGGLAKDNRPTQQSTPAAPLDVGLPKSLLQDPYLYGHLCRHPLHWYSRSSTFRQMQGFHGISFTLNSRYIRMLEIDFT